MRTKLLLFTALFALLAFVGLIGSVQAQNFQWVSQASGDADVATSFAIAKDEGGNTYITGSYMGSNGTAVFGNTNLFGSGYFTAKLDPLGNFLWARTTVGGAGVVGRSIEVDTAGNVYVVGYFHSQSECVFLSPTNNITLRKNYLTTGGSPEGFIVKYDKNGNLLWGAAAAGTNSHKTEMILDVDVDVEGNAYATGVFERTARFNHATGGGLSLTSTALSPDIFVVKYNPNGQVQWVRQAGGSASDRGYGVACTPTGKVLVVGAYNNDNNDVLFQTQQVPAYGLADNFIAQYDSQGNLDWVKGYGNSTASIEGVYDTPKVAADKNGNALIAGSFYKEVYYDASLVLTAHNASLPSSNSSAYMLKVNPSGALVWAQHAGSADNTAAAYSTDVAVDTSGNSYFVGDYSGLPIFGPLTVNPAQSSDMFVVKFDPDGNWQWIKSAGGPATEETNSLVVSPSGCSLWATGRFGLMDSPASFDTITLTPVGNSDIFVSRMYDCPPGGVLTTTGGPGGPLTGYCATGNGGTLTLRDHAGIIRQWESSTDCQNFSNPQIIEHTGATYQWSNLTQTTCFRVKVEIANGVFVYSNVGRVTVAQPLTAQLVFNNGTACNVDGGMIYVSAASGGSGLYEYSIDGGQTWQQNHMFFNLPSGGYSVWVRDANAPACKIHLGNVQIMNPRSPSIGVNGPQVVCAGNTVQFNASGAEMYSWNPPANLSNAQSANPLFTTMTPGVYTYVVTGWYANYPQCTSSVAHVIQVLAAPQPPVATGMTVCNGETATLVASPPTMSITWWDSNFGGNLLGSGPTFVTPPLTQSTVYFVQASQGNCHSQRTAVSVVVLPPMNAVVQFASSQTCSETGNGYIQVLNPLGGSGSYEYSIDGGLTWRTSPVFQGLAQGTYPVWIRDAQFPQCRRFLQDVVIGAPQPVVITAGGPYTVCAGNTVQFNVTGAEMYSWTPQTFLSNPNSPNPLFSTNLPGTYTYVVTGWRANYPNCTASAAVVVTVLPAPPTPQVQGAIVCYGQSATVIASPPTANISWWDAPTGGNWLANGHAFVTSPLTQPRVYYVQSSYGNCLSPRVPVTVGVRQPLTAQVITNNVTGCAGANNGMIYVTTFTGGVEYSIDGGQTWQQDRMFLNLSAGTYSLSMRYIQQPQCPTTVITAITITEPQPLSAQVLSFDSQDCAEGSGWIYVTNQSGGSGLFEYSIDGGQTWQQLHYFQGLPPGTYPVLIRDAQNPNCMKFLRDVVINAPQPPVITGGGPYQTCAGQPITLNAGGAEMYSWNPPVFLSNPQSANPVFSATAPGVYTYVVTGWRANYPNCTGTALVTVTVQPPVQIIAKSMTNPICENGAAVLVATGAASYHWQPINKTGPTVTVKPTTTTTYTVTGFKNGCSNSATVTVQVISYPNFKAWATPPAKCEPGFFVLDATAGAKTYNWQPGNYVGRPVSVYLVQTTTFTLNAQIGNCTVQRTVTVKVGKPTLAVEKSYVKICAGESVTLNATGSAGAFLWTPGQMTSPSITVTPTQTTTYTVSLTDDKGCTSKKTVTVEVNPAPGVVASTVRHASCTQEGLITAAYVGNYPNRPYSYSWQPGDMTGPTHYVTPSQTTAYTVTIRDGQTGCTNTASTTVQFMGGEVQASISGLSQTYLTTDAPVQLSGQPGGGTFSGPGMEGDVFHPSSLEPGTYSICYTGSIGSCSFSHCQTVTIVAPAVCDPVPLASLIQIGNRHFVLAWSTTSTAVSYEIFVRPVNQATGQTYSVPAQSHPSNMTYTVANLSPMTVYWVQVRAVCPGPVYSAWTGPYFAYTTPRLGDQSDEQAQPVAVYPNPNKGSFTVRLNAEQGTSIEMSLRDLAGRTIWNDRRVSTVGNEELHVSLSDAASGVYLLEMRWNNRRETVKVVIE